MNDEGGRWLASLLILALATWPLPKTNAAEDPASPNYSGDLMSRSTLTGDWGGARDHLAAKGLTFDLSATQYFGGVFSGGVNSHWNYDGRGDFLFNLDTQKLGLWPGGFFTLEAEGRWGSTINTDVGAIMPVDSNALYPEPGENTIDLPNVSFTQFLSPHFGIFAGKLATVTRDSGDMNAFAHGKGDTQFMNVAFNVNPIALIVPYSALGAGVMIAPFATPEDGVVALSVLDAEGNPGETGFPTVFEGGTVFVGEGRITTHFFDRTGHQLIGAVYSDKLYRSLDQSFRLIVENRGLVQTSGAWSFYYNFDQYLYEPEKGRGVGVFGRFGIGDGDPNPVKMFWSVGVGGNGLIAARPNDGFGIGFYQTIVSDENVTSLLNLNDEWGVEAYYDIAITPWAHLSPDLQYIDGAGSRGDPAWVAGMRLRLDF